MRGKTLIGMLLFAHVTFSEIYITDETAQINHPGGTHRINLTEVAFDEEDRMFGKKNNLRIRSYAPSKRQQIDLIDIMSAVKNQGQRGSCSAFATLGLVEAFFDKNIDYSEQCLILFHDQKDSGNLLDRLTFTRIHVAWTWKLERNCLYQDPATFDEWIGANDEKKQELKIKARDMRVMTPRTTDLFDFLDNLEGTIISKEPHFNIFSSKFNDFSSSERIKHVREQLLASRPVGVSLFVPGDGWVRGMIDKMPTDKEIAENCVKKTNAKLKKCGSHAVILTGFNDEKRLLYFKNSWGEDWGLTEKYQETENPEERIGYGAMSYEYFARFGMGELITLQE